VYETDNSAIIAILNEEQKIDLHKEVDYYLRIKKYSLEGTTIKDILHMQSGIAEDTTINSGDI
jgi:CubicO group peptidase (beta-lactamase class C family)